MSNRRRRAVKPAAAARRRGAEEEEEEEEENSSSDSAEEPNPLARGAAFTDAQLRSSMTKWRNNAEAIKLLQAEQRTLEAQLRGYMEHKEIDDLPITAADGSGRVGFLRMMRTEAWRPLTKGLLQDLFDGYDRIDAATRDHFREYIWKGRERGPPVTRVAFVCA